MAYEPSYTDCIKRQPESGSGAELALLQLVRTGNRCVPAGLDRVDSLPLPEYTVCPYIVRCHVAAGGFYGF